MQKTDTIKSYRIFLLVIGMGIIPFQPVFLWAIPGANDPIILRVIIGTIGLFIFAISYVFAGVRKNLTPFVYTVAYLVSGWLIWLMYVNNAHSAYVLAYVVGFSAFCNYFDSPSSLLSFTLINTVASFFSLIMVENPLVNKWIFITVMPTLHLLSYAAASAKFKLRESLLKNEKSLKTIFDESVDALFLIDSKTMRIADVNQQGVLTFGASSKEALIGASVFPEGENRALITAGIDGAEGKDAQARISSGEVWRRQRQITTIGEKCIWADVSLKMIASGDSNRILLRISDISKIKEAEQVLVGEKEELKKMNDLMVGRELAMVELKKQIEELKSIK